MISASIPLDQPRVSGERTTPVRHSPPACPLVWVRESTLKPFGLALERPAGLCEGWPHSSLWPEPEITPITIVQMSFPSRSETRLTAFSRFSAASAAAARALVSPRLDWDTAAGVSGWDGWGGGGARGGGGPACGGASGSGGGGGNVGGDDVELCPWWPCVESESLCPLECLEWCEPMVEDSGKDGVSAWSCAKLGNLDQLCRVRLPLPSHPIREWDIARNNTR
jgi:hypothetical protein